MTLLDPDEDQTAEPDGDEDESTAPLLGVVQPPIVVPPDHPYPPGHADATVRRAAVWVETELVRLRTLRADRDRDGLAEIDAMRRRLIEERRATNAEIKALVAEQARLARLVRVLNAK